MFFIHSHHTSPHPPIPLIYSYTNSIYYPFHAFQ
jgi:hypothetical protein